MHENKQILHFYHVRQTMTTLEIIRNIFVFMTTFWYKTSLLENVVIATA